eukprot:UN17898
MRSSNRIKPQLITTPLPLNPPAYLCRGGPKKEPETTSDNNTNSIQNASDLITPTTIGEEIDDSDFIPVVRRSRKRKARPETLLQDKNSHEKNTKPYGKQPSRKNERKLKDKQRKHKDQQQNKAKLR